MILNDYPTGKFTIIYALIFGGLAFLFFLFCYTLSFYDGDLRLSVLKSVARAAYGGRIGPIQFSSNCARYDPGLGYLLRPGSCRFARSEFDIAVSVNSFGVRDDVESLAAPEIIMLGDSHTMGLGVSDETTFSSLVEKELRRKTLNAGISSYGTAREMMLFDRLDTTNAKYIVLQYCDNDYKENVAYVRGDGKLDVLSQEEYTQWVEINKYRQTSFLTPGLSVFHRTTDRVMRFLSVGEKAKAAVKEGEAFRFVIEKNKQKLKNRTIIIFEINGHNQNDNSFINDVRERLADSGLSVFFIQTSDFLNNEDYFNLDNHMRPSGHRKVAGAIVDVIRRLEGEGASSRSGQKGS